LGLKNDVILLYFLTRPLGKKTIYRLGVGKFEDFETHFRIKSGRLKVSVSVVLDEPRNKLSISLKGDTDASILDCVKIAQKK
jgi:hypothetical protein